MRLRKLRFHLSLRPRCCIFAYNNVIMARNVAAVLAGGKGSRTGFGVPKQFVELCGCTVLERSVDAFEENALISDIVIVSAADYVTHVEEMARRNAWTKLRAVVAGGKERCDSTRAAINACPVGVDNILFHDAARPLVSQRIINDVCTALERYVAVSVAVPSTDSLIEVHDGKMCRPIDRSCVWRAQTPQAFRHSVIAGAYRKAAGDPNFFATDDCAVVMMYMPGAEITVVPGEETNIKLTYADDAARIEDIIRRRTGKDI